MVSEFDYDAQVDDDEQVFERDRHSCRMCGRVFPSEQLQVYSLNGSASRRLGHLATACSHCYVTRTSEGRSRRGRR